MGPKSVYFIASIVKPELGKSKNPYDAMFKRVNLNDLVNAFHNSTLILIG